MTTPTPLSARGAQLLASPPMPPYLEAHFARAQGRRTAEDPDGYIPLCVAENSLMATEFAARLQQVQVSPASLGYGPMIGAHSFRAALAELLGPRLFGRTVQPEQLAVLAGAGAVLEVLFSVLCDPGEAVLVPTPSYAGFWADLQTRDELVVVPVPRRAEDGYSLSLAALDRAISDSPNPVRALLYTHPDNPLGRVSSAEELDALLDWGERRGVQIVFDEIYGLSVFGEAPFSSAASRRERLGPGVHIVWAFSKDFGASGLRCGLLLSESQPVLSAVATLAYWAAVSSDTQVRLEAVVRDLSWVDAYLEENRRRLGETCRLVSRALRDGGVPFVSAEAGFFVLCDLRGFLAEPTFDGEDVLWRELLAQNVNLTPGAACRVEEPGFFRLCFAAVPQDDVLAGIARLVAVLRAR